MAIELQSSITTPSRSEWLAYTPINAADAGDVIEPLQQTYARAGAKCFDLLGPWETTDGTGYTTTNNAAGPDLDELDAVSLTRRPDSGGGYRVELSIWGYDVDVRLTAIRIDSDGTTTQIAQDTASGTGGTLAHISLALALTAAQTREGGVSGGDQAPIKYSLEAKHRQLDAAKAQLVNGTIAEQELTPAQLP